MGDVQQQVPSGPFDLALCSLILLHTQQPQQVLQNVYAQLNPGGRLLIIELSTKLPEMAEFGPTYQRLTELLFVAMTRMGVHPRIMDELPELLRASGFVDYARHERADDHPMLTQNATEAVLSQSVGIATIYNARMGIAAATGTSPSTIEHMIAEVVAEWSVSPMTQPPAVYVVDTARKP